jgi:hypothetical protein
MNLLGSKFVIQQAVSLVLFLFRTSEREMNMASKAKLTPLAIVGKPHNKKKKKIWNF